MSDKVPVTTLADLGRLAGVSASTVSRALAGNPVVGAETRQRITALADAHGFQVNRMARNLRLGRTGAVAVVLPLGHEADQSLSDPFFMSLLGPLADEISARGEDLLLSRVIPRGPGWLDEIADAGRVDGIILIGQSNQFPVIERTAARYRPLVVWGAAAPGARQLTVGSDNHAGGRLAAAHLLGLGRRRIAFVGNPSVPEFAARHAGLTEGLAAAGLTPQLLPAALTAEGAHAAIAAALAAEPPPDGIFAASDIIAMSALRALAERGLSVPGDVAVIGYDDIPLAAHTAPPLTTIRQDVRRGARLLVELLFGRISGDDGAPVTMVPELVRRGSA